MTITVKLPDKLEAELRARVDAQKLELSEFVRQAIAEKLEREPAAMEAGRPSAYELGKHLFGRYESERSDLAENYEQILREKLRAKHSG